MPDETSDTPAAEETDAPLESIDGLIPPIEGEEAEETETPAAETEPETPAEEVEAEPADETPAAKTPAAAAPKTDPAADEEKALADRFAKYRADRAALDARRAAPGYTFDPFLDGEEATRLTLEYTALSEIRLAQVEQQQAHRTQEAKYETFFSELAPQYPGVDVRDLWQKTLAEAQKRWPEAVAVGVATEKFEERLKLAKATPPAAKIPAKLPPKVTKGGAVTAPKGTVASNGAPRKRDAEEEFIAASSSGIRDFV